MGVVTTTGVVDDIMAGEASVGEWVEAADTLITASVVGSVMAVVIGSDVRQSLPLPGRSCC